MTTTIKSTIQNRIHVNNIDTTKNKDDDVLTARAPRNNNLDDCHHHHHPCCHHYHDSLWIKAKTANMAKVKYCKREISLKCLKIL